MDLSIAKQIILPHLPYYRWHPEVAIRYLPIVKALKQAPDGSVLEVGSGGIGIAPYLGTQVTGLDSDFSGPIHPLLKKHFGNGTNLPFADKSFDFVISTDTLEHVTPTSRSKVIKEMLRVAKHMVIIATPTGIESQKQDQLLADHFEKIFGHQFPFLAEHDKHGLPEIATITKAINNAAKNLHKNIKLSTIGNENLFLRRFLMEGWMSKNPFFNFFHRKIMLLFISVFLFLDRPPYYRSIFYATIKED